MEALKKRINSKKEGNNHKKIYDIIMYSNKHNPNIIDWLKGTLYIEEKSKRYKDVVLRLFINYLNYLERIESKDIKIITDNNRKKYFSQYLNLEKIKAFYSSKKLSDSSKIVYINILRKYVELFNNEGQKYKNYFGLNYSKIRKKPLTKTEKTILKKIKDSKNIELICCYYLLYYLGLNIYNLSKLLFKNLKNNGKTLRFISYKYKKNCYK